jgi:hypothetical protein
MTKISYQIIIDTSSPANSGDSDLKSMYAVIQYSDYRKGSTIRIHGYTNDKEKAIDKVVVLAQTTLFFTPGEFRIVKEISILNNDNEYVCLMPTPQGKVISQYSSNIIDFARFNESTLDLSIVKKYLGELDNKPLMIEDILAKAEAKMLSTEELDMMFKELNVGLTCEIFAVLEMKELEI